MSGLAGLLAGHHPPGVVRWHAAFRVPDVRHSVEHSGWSFGYVDGWGIGSIAELHGPLAAALGFPDHYGRNLDALWDCLSDLSEPTVLLWDGWGPLARSQPEPFAALLRVLQDRSVTRPPFSALLRGEGPAVDLPSLD